MDLHFQNICLSLDGRWLFKDFNLRVKSGEKVLLRGPSGSGKSTLLRMLLGFVQPLQGEVWLGKERLTAKSVWGLRQTIGYVPQDLRLGNSTVRQFLEDLFSYRANRHLQPTASDIVQLFQQFHLPEGTLGKSTGQLSGGERQRLAIIAALLLRRPAYLLDEATSALDEQLKQQVIEHFYSLEDCTVLAVAHQSNWPGFREISLAD